jgi:hypothetical protein
MVMARQKSELKSGIGKSMRTFTALIEAVEDLGGGDEQLRRIETNADLRQELAKLIVGQNASSTGNFHRVTVDRDKKLKAMIQAGRYDWTNSDITDKHFPVEGSGVVEVDIELVHYGHTMSTDAVLKNLDTRGLRPAKIEELLALGAAKPELQREFPIIVLGSVWRDPVGCQFVPCLVWGGSKRDLDLNWIDGTWGGLCRFLAVRK